MTQDPKEIALRYRAMFGKGWQGKMARCIGCGDNVISFQVRGRAAVQHWFAAYIEFFEVTPRALWPERWALLREAADRCSPLVGDFDERIPCISDGSDLEDFATVWSETTGLPAPEGDELVRLFFACMEKSASPLVAETDGEDAR